MYMLKYWDLRGQIEHLRVHVDRVSEKADESEISDEVDQGLISLVDTSRHY